MASAASVALAAPKAVGRVTTLSGLAGGRDGVDLASIIIVVPAPKDHNVASAPFHREIVTPLLEAGLQVRAFEGVHDMQGDFDVFLQVYATTARLLREAERIKMVLELDEKALADADERKNQELVAEGKVTFSERGGDSEHLDLHIPTVPAYWCGFIKAGLNPYERIWGPYTADPTVLPLLRVYPETGTILSQPQALKLLCSIIEARSDLHGGANINLDALRVRDRIKKWFPAQDAAGLASLEQRWSNCRPPWNVPVGQVKAYFGERVGFYFGFLGHYTFWLLFPAIVGFGIFVHQEVYGSPNVDYLVVVGIAVALWSTLFMEAWKREQHKLATKWGMTNYNKVEPMRPEYVATARPVRSFVDGKPTFAFNPFSYRARFTFSMSINMTMLGAVVVVVGLIFWLRVLLTQQSKARGGQLPNDMPNILTSVINAVQIQITNRVYTWMAHKLTDFENHATATAYDNSLTTKMALFQCINTYFGLFYIAAIKNHITISGDKQTCALNAQGEPDCMLELRSQLAVLMITRFVLGNFTELVLPWLISKAKALFNRCRVRDTAANREALAAIKVAKQASHMELEAEFPVYDAFEEYLEIMLQYGFVTLFVVAFPLAPLVALISCVVEVYIDRAKMLRFTTRPVPESAQNIGAWLYVFEALSYLSTVSNLSIVVFTNRAGIFGRDWDTYQRLVFFIVAEHLVLLLKYAIATYIPDEPFESSLQLERQSYLVTKHVFHVEDVADVPQNDLVELSPTDGTGGAGAGAGAGGAGAGRPRQASIAHGSTRNIPVASSYFTLTGVVDPRGTSLAPNPLNLTVDARSGVQPVSPSPRSTDSGSHSSYAAASNPMHGGSAV